MNCVWCYAVSNGKRYCSASCRASHREMARTISDIASAVFSVNEDGCWVWPGKEPHQYGPYKRLFRHLRGRIPKGLVPDHLCRNRPCVNPWHIELVTHKENTLRGTAPTAVNAAKTHCIHGHEFTPENTYTSKEGWRWCRSCKAEYFRRYNKGRLHKFREYRILAKSKPGYDARQKAIYAKKQAKKLHEETCVICGSLFTTAEGSTCSRKCRGVHSRRGAMGTCLT